MPSDVEMDRALRQAGDTWRAGLAPARAPFAVDTTEPIPPARTRRPSRILAVAAASSVVLVGAGVVAVVRGDDTGTDQVAVQATPTPIVSFDRGPTPPELTLDGWRRTYAHQGVTGTPEGLGASPAASRLFLVVTDPARGFDGPRIRVGVAAAPEGFSAGAGARPVDVNGITAELGTGNLHKVYLTWSPAPDRAIYLDGTRATVDQVLTVARGLHVSDDLTTATATEVPAGLEATPLDPVDADGTWAEYRFERDGTLLQVDFYPGGRATFEGRASDPAHNATVRNTAAAMRDEGGSDDHYWVDLQDGRWTVEVAGGPFPDEATFINTVNALRPTP